MLYLCGIKQCYNYTNNVVQVCDTFNTVVYSVNFGICMIFFFLMLYHSFVAER